MLLGPIPSRTSRAQLCAGGWLVFVTACQSAPYADPAGESAERVIVQVLDRHFVRVAGTRMPWEQLIYDMRTICRRARADGELPPTIELQLPTTPDADPSDVLDHIQSGLRAAGIRHLEVTIGGS